MHTFSDAAGKSWQIEITIGSARRFKKIDLINGAPEKLVSQLTESPLTRIEMAWHFCTNKEESTQEQFEDNLTPAVILAMDEAVWDELVVFTQSLRPEVADMIPGLRDRFRMLISKSMGTILEMAESDELQQAMESKFNEVRKEAISNFSSMQLEHSE